MEIEIKSLKNKRCSYDICQERATSVVYDRKKRKVDVYCDHHAEIVVNYCGPEYTQDCPNCGCQIPVN